MCIPGAQRSLIKTLHVTTQILRIFKIVSIVPLQLLIIADSQSSQNHVPISFSVIKSKLRFFSYFCCRYYFYFCSPSPKASSLERVRHWHSFRLSTTLTMLFKKSIIMTMLMLMLLPLLKVLSSFFGQEIIV